MRAIDLTALVAASVVGLAVFATPASSQRNVINHGFSLDEAALVKEAGNRRGRIHATRPRSYGDLCNASLALSSQLPVLRRRS